MNIMRMSVRLLLLVLVSFCIYGCSPYGCTDEYANNFEEDAGTDDGTCTYSSRTISFYTNSSVGGDIHVELSVSSTNDYYIVYGDESPSSSVNFDINDAYYPLCGYENLAVFNRFTSKLYNYDAHDKDGNTWSGTVSAEAGQCKLVELNRDPNAYGTIHLYTSKSGNNNLEAIANPMGNSFDDNRTIVFNESDVYSSSAPSCGNASYGILRSKVGSANVNVQSTNPFNKKIDVNIPVTVNPQGCTLVDIADYI